MQPITPLVGPVTRPKFVLFGSSIVEYSIQEEGWGAILADKYSRKADIIVRGYGGWNSRRGLEVLEKVFPKNNLVQPALVIVYFGGNDSTAPYDGSPHVPLDEYLTNMKKIANHIRSLSSTTRMIFLSSPPMNEYQIADLHADFALVRTNQLSKMYSDALIKMCNEMKIKVIDMFATIQSKPGWWKTYFTDGIHFTADGSQTLAAEILKVLKEADWKPHLYYENMPIEFDGNSTTNVTNSTLSSQKEESDSGNKRLHSAL